MFSNTKCMLHPGIALNKWLKDNEWIYGIMSLFPGKKQVPWTGPAIAQALNIFHFVSDLLVLNHTWYSDKFFLQIMLSPSNQQPHKGCLNQGRTLECSQNRNWSGKIQTSLSSCGNSIWNKDTHRQLLMQLRRMMSIASDNFQH